MERPSVPRRKSSAGEENDGLSKTKAHRKSFVVGTKSHHRVPSYGKKLNQLSKLTALTTNDNKPQDNATIGSPRRASMNRSMSQKSLSDTRASRKNGSTQDLRKLRRSSSHHGSSARLSIIKPLTKTETKQQAQDSNADTVTDDSNEESLISATNKRPTFVIEDEDEEEDEEVEHVAELFANKVRLSDEEPRSLSEPTAPVASPVLSPRSTLSPPQKGPSQESSSTKEENPKSASPQTEKSTKSTTNGPSKAAAPHQVASATGLLFRPAGSPVVPHLSTESAVSKDIQIKERPVSGRSMSMLNVASTPVNSQPLTSKFLESPRGNGPMLATAHQQSSLSKESDGSGAPGVPKPSINTIYQNSPQGSTTNLGGGSSRTQQKLLLQRASSIYFDGIADSVTDAKSNTPIRPKANKEIDRISREYKNVRRFRDPSKELAYRLYANGSAIPSVPQLRRTMTQIALTNGHGDIKTPKASQSSSNLRSQQVASKTTSSEIEKMLQEFWLRDDHVSHVEE